MAGALANTYRYDRNDRRAAVEHAEIAVDAATRFPNAVPPGDAADAHDRHGWCLTRLGRYGEAAQALARAHRIHLRVPANHDYVYHLWKVCLVRACCGHPAKAERTLRRVVDNRALLALVDPRRGSPWRPHLTLAFLRLWVGDEKGAVRTAKAALDVPPQHADLSVVHLLGVRLGWADTAEQAAAMELLQ